MDQQQRGIIQKNYVALVRDLECSEDFLSYFVPQRVMTETMIEEIMSKTTGKKKNTHFWITVQKKGTHAFDILYDALIETFQFDVADLLKPQLAPSRLNATEPVQETGDPGGAAGGGGAGGGGGDRGGDRGGDGDSPNVGGPGRSGHPREMIHEEVDRPPTAHPDDDADSELSDEDEYLDERIDYLDEISLRVNPTWKRKIKDLFFSDNVYRMSTPSRGRCLVINNRYFDQEPKSPGQERLDQRDGSEMDVKNISKVFKRLSFECEVKSELTAQDMVAAIKEETKDHRHKGQGCFVLVIMTHGTENLIYGQDGRGVKHSDIFDLMSPYKFPAMAGRPKVIILQACSGGRTDTMGRFANDSGSTKSDSRPPPSQFPSSTAADPVDTQSTAAVPSSPIEKPFPGAFLSTDDMYIMKASFLSYVSSRHTRQGTWFIRAIVEALYKHACHRDLQSLFRQVQKKVRNKSIVSQRMHGHTSGQMPTDTCTFRDDKKLYLFPGYNPADHA